MSRSCWTFSLSTRTNIPSQIATLKMIFLFQWWDMLVPWKLHSIDCNWKSLMWNCFTPQGAQPWHISTWNLWTSSILGFEFSKRRLFPFKTRVIWDPGSWTYVVYLCLFMYFVFFFFEVPFLATFFFCLEIRSNHLVTFFVLLFLMILGFGLLNGLERIVWIVWGKVNLPTDFEKKGL